MARYMGSGLRGLIYLLFKRGPVGPIPDPKVSSKVNPLLPISNLIIAEVCKTLSEYCKYAMPLKIVLLKLADTKKKHLLHI